MKKGYSNLNMNSQSAQLSYDLLEKIWSINVDVSIHSWSSMGVGLVAEGDMTHSNGGIAFPLTHLISFYCVISRFVSVLESDHTPANIVQLGW